MSVGSNPGGVRNVEPDEVWSALSERRDAVLVDVRTTAEWTYVGLPNLDAVGKKPILIEWQTFPAMSVNASFVTTLAAALTEAGVSHDAPIFFLCRSGARSKSAAEAMLSAGWTNSINIAGGFEGTLDPAGRRGTTNGWKASGLPWAQT